MDEQKNIQIIQTAYAAFGRNDIDALLGLMSDDIDWQIYGPAELPTSGQRRGKPEVKKFFQQVGDAWNFEQFEPRQFIAQGDVVVSLGFYKGTSKTARRPFQAEFAHVFTVKGGKVVRWREYTDTANLINAYAPTTARV